MYAEREIIDRVRECLQRRAHVESPELRDLADQYAKLCRNVRNRLELCAGYLARGLRAEAKHVAESNPPLLELARILTLPDLNAWPDLCLAYGFHEPAFIPRDLVQMLETAFNPQRTEATVLDRLLRDHRRAALIGTTRERVQVLRCISHADAGNSNWKADLKLLEEFRLSEIAIECEDAKRRVDESALAALRVELQSPDWAVLKPSAGLLEMANERYRAVRKTVLAESAREVVRRSLNVFTAGNYGALDQAISEWVAIENDEDWERDAQLCEQIREAKTWYTKEREKRLQEKQFEDAVASLRKAVEDGSGVEAVEEALKHANGLGRELPSEVADSARAKIASLRKAQSRQRMMKVAGLSLGAAASLLLVVLTVHSLIQKSKRDAWAKRLDAAISEARWEEASNLLDQLAKDAPSIANHPAFKERKSQVEHELEEERSRQKSLTRLLDECDALLERTASTLAAARDDQETDRTDLRDVRAKLSLAAGYVRGSRDREAFSATELRIRAAEDDCRQRDERRFRREIDRAGEFLTVIEKGDPVLDESVCNESLRHCEECIERAAHVGEITPDQKTTLAQIRDRRDRMKRRIEEAHRGARELMELRKALESTDLKTFQGALEKMSTWASLSTEEKESYRHLLGLIPLYHDVVRAQKWKLSDNAASRERALQCQKGPDRGPDFWGGALAILVENSPVYRSTAELWSKFERDWQKNRLLYELWQIQDAKRPIKTVYFVDKPECTGKANDDELWKVGAYSKCDGEPTLEQVIVPAGQFWKRATYVPHVAFLRGLAERKTLQTETEVEDALWNELRRLSDTPGLNPIVGVFLAREIKRPLANLEKRLPALLSGYGDWERMVIKEDWLALDENSLELKRYRALIEELRGDDLRGRVASDLKRWRCTTELSRAAVSRGVCCVGQVRCSSSDVDLQIWTKDTSSRELWGVDMSGTAPRCWVFATRQGNEWVIDARVQSRLLDRQRIFAPTDGKTTKELLVDILTRLQQSPKDLDGVEFPSCWPENAR